MSKISMSDLFIRELEDMFSSENQIVKALPKLIKTASSANLKAALSNHLSETKKQVTRIKNIFTALKRKPAKKNCKAMQGLIQEANDLLKNKTKSATLDAAIIASAQKIEHYEIASYGTLRSFAKHLNFDSKVVNLIQESLDEEGAADKKLTKIAEGGFFSQGINENAVRAKPVVSRAKSTRTTKTAAKRTTTAKKRVSTAKKRPSTAARLTARAHGRTVTKSRKATKSAKRSVKSFNSKASSRSPMLARR